jgi:hypothetical protein
MSADALIAPMQIFFVVLPPSGIAALGVPIEKSRLIRRFLSLTQFSPTLWPPTENGMFMWTVSAISHSKIIGHGYLAVIEAWNLEYRGDAYKILLRAVDEVHRLPVESHYLKLLPVVQSSGTENLKL